MKKHFRILYAATIFSCLMSIPAWAAETRKDYKEEVAPIRAEIKSLEEEMKPLREENKASAVRYKSVRLSKKESGSLSVSKESWKKAKELHSQIVAIRKDRGTSNAKELRQQAKNAVKEKNFDTAIQNMNQVLEQKKTRLDSLREINKIWKEIDQILAQG